MDNFCEIWLKESLIQLKSYMKYFMKQKNELKPLSWDRERAYQFFEPLPE